MDSLLWSRDDGRLTLARSRIGADGYEMRARVPQRGTSICTGLSPAEALALACAILADQGYEPRPLPRRPVVRTLEDPPDLLLVSEVAAQFRVDRGTVSRWIREKKLTPVVLPSGRVRVAADEVEALLTGAAR